MNGPKLLPVETVTTEQGQRIDWCSWKKFISTAIKVGEEMEATRFLRNLSITTRADLSQPPEIPMMSLGRFSSTVAGPWLPHSEKIQIAYRKDGTYPPEIALAAAPGLCRSMAAEALKVTGVKSPEDITAKYPDRKRVIIILSQSAYLINEGSLTLKYHMTSLIEG